MEYSYVGFVEQSEISCIYDPDTRKWKSEAIHTQKRKLNDETDWETKTISSSATDKTLKRAMTMALLTIETYMEKRHGSLFDDLEISQLEKPEE